MEISLAPPILELYKTGKTSDKALKKLIKKYSWIPTELVATIDLLLSIERTSILYSGFRRLAYEQLKGDMRGFSSVRLRHSEPIRMIFREYDEGIRIEVIEINRHYGDH